MGFYFVSLRTSPSSSNATTARTSYLTSVYTHAGSTPSSKEYSTLTTGSTTYTTTVQPTLSTPLSTEHTTAGSGPKYSSAKTRTTSTTGTGTATTSRPSSLVTGVGGLSTIDASTLTTYDPASTGVDGILAWNSWTMWTRCSASCRGGIRSRIQLCYQLTQDCEKELLYQPLNLTIGYHLAYGSCNEFDCPIIPLWLPWTPWGQCSCTCGKCTRRRTRYCIAGSFLTSTANCSGFDYEAEFCQVDQCIYKFVPVVVSIDNEKPFHLSDSRPSAITIGVMGVTLVLAVTLIILSLDLISLTIHCKKKAADRDRHRTSARPRRVESVEFGIEQDNNT